METHTTVVKGLAFDILIIETEVVPSVWTVWRLE